MQENIKRDGRYGEPEMVCKLHCGYPIAMKFGLNKSVEFEVGTSQPEALSYQRKKKINILKCHRNRLSHGWRV